MMENRVYLPADFNNSELTCVATYTSESGSVQHKSTLHLTGGRNTAFQMEQRSYFISGSVVNC